ncbi:MAG: hypothetical protein JSS95_07325 [Acidobacteria bacterium]|nr:hypothetical protein [Acidobacteriota bacterium]
MMIMLSGRAHHLRWVLPIAASLATHFAVCQTPAATLPAGTPLPVYIDDHIPMHAGEPIRAHLLYPVYVGNVLILPEKTIVTGVVKELHPNRSQRNNARLNGDFTPFHTPVVGFTGITLPDGTTLQMTTNTATDGAPLYRLVAPPPRKGGFIRKQYDTGMLILHEQLDVITAPHKGDRLLQLFYRQLPYHPERIERGTAWTIETTDPVEIPAQPAFPVAATTPDKTKSPAAHDSQQSWFVQAYLGKELSSATAKVGEPIKATVAEPIYNPDHTIAVPQGATLVGAITKAKPARPFGRAGTLGFDFSQLILPDGYTQSIQSELKGIDSASTVDLEMNSEGKVQPKPQDKIVVPLLLALLATRPLDEDRDFQGGRNFVGANGFGLIGNIVGLAGGSKYVATGIGAYGTAISLYRRWIASGHQVTFPPDTRIVLQTTARKSTVLKPSSR